MTDPSVAYPILADDAAPKLSFGQWRRRQWRTLKWRFGGDPDLTAQLEGLDRLRGIGRDEVVVMTRQRDGIRFIRSFLRHYRALGADRFVVIDERSTDGTPEFLATQPDVITLTARTSFAEAIRGNQWFNAAFMNLPKRQRIVYVDNDEYLVFGDGRQSLRDLFDAMKRRGMDRLATMMLDLYPPAPIRDAIFDGTDDTLPWDVAPLFDASGYRLYEGMRGMRVTGGVRQRLFGEELFLTKYSAMFNPKRAIIDKSVHTPRPFTHNRGPTAGALLHFKYFSDFVDDHKRVVERGVHNKGGQTYQAVLDQLEGIDVGSAFDFTGDCTRRYTGPAQLCELGLIEDIFGGD